jgi:hypothetical protein
MQCWQRFQKLRQPGWRPFNFKKKRPKRGSPPSVIPPTSEESSEAAEEVAPSVWPTIRSSEIETLIGSGASALSMLDGTSL